MDATLKLCVLQDVSAVPSNSAIRSRNPINIEESSSSYKTSVPYVTTQNDLGFGSSSATEHDVSASNVTFFFGSGASRVTC